MRGPWRKPRSLSEMILKNLVHEINQLVRIYIHYVYENIPPNACDCSDTHVYGSTTVLVVHYYEYFTT
jgi:hypothetical protein